MQEYLACPACTFVIVLIANAICIGIMKLFKKKTNKCTCKCHENHEQDNFK